MIRKDRMRLWANPRVAPRVYFRWATPADADKEYLGWLKDPEVLRWLSFPSHRVVDLRAYIRSQVNKGGAVAFFIIHIRPGPVETPMIDAPRIGTLKLVKEKNGTATLGLILGRARGYGYGVEAITLACQFAKDRWGIRQVECGIHADNHRSIRAFTKAGFTIRPKTVWGTRVS
jgi:RimJ/RimL family protein N-acetyltransferase